MHPLGSWLIRRAIPLAVTCGAAACSLTTSLTGLSGADAPDGGQSAGDSGDAGGGAATDAVRDASGSDGPIGLRVTRLRLINNDTGKPLNGYDPLASEVTLAVADFANATLEAFAEGPLAVGSIGFDIDSVRESTENRTPYVISGDRDGGGYYVWKPPIGTFFVTATPYSGSERTGTAGAPLQVRFTVQP